MTAPPPRLPGAPERDGKVGLRPVARFRMPLMSATFGVVPNPLGLFRLTMPPVIVTFGDGPNAFAASTFKVPAVMARLVPGDRAGAAAATVRVPDPVLANEPASGAAIVAVMAVLLTAIVGPAEALLERVSVAAPVTFQPNELVGLSKTSEP